MNERKGRGGRGSDSDRSSGCDFSDSARHRRRLLWATTLPPYHPTTTTRWPSPSSINTLHAVRHQLQQWKCMWISHNLHAKLVGRVPLLAAGCWPACLLASCLRGWSLGLVLVLVILLEPWQSTVEIQYLGDEVSIESCVFFCSSLWWHLWFGELFGTALAYEAPMCRLLDLSYYLSTDPYENTT